jgi:hypothetical protein
LHLTFQPLLALVVLAVRAKAMTAGMRNEFLVIAAFALDLHHRAGRAAAMPQRRERSKLVKGQPGAKLREKVGFEGLDDVSEADHRAFPPKREKRSIKPLMRSMA